MRDVDAVAAEHFGLIEGLMRQTGLHRHYLADEFRSEAGMQLARCVLDRLGGVEGDPRLYLARTILVAFATVKRRFLRQRRTWASLDAALGAGLAPTSREPAPWFLAELREEVDLDAAAAGDLKETPQKKRLTTGQRAALLALIRDNPAMNNRAVRRAFLARERVSVAGPTVAHYRRKTGVPNPRTPGGTGRGGGTPAGPRPPQPSSEPGATRP
jgi:hypothetical protein